MLVFGRSIFSIVIKKSIERCEAFDNLKYDKRLKYVCHDMSLDIIKNRQSFSAVSPKNSPQQGHTLQSAYHKTRALTIATMGTKISTLLSTVGVAEQT